MVNRKVNMNTNEQQPMRLKSIIKMTKVKLWSTVVIVSSLVIGGGALFLAKSVPKADAVEITVYKSPACNCCNKWVDHLRDAGFLVTAKNSSDMDSIKLSAGVKPMLRSCHTALVEGYVVEGHVPASDIKRLLQERPAVSGLTVPGMPMGSPGMEGNYTDPYEVLTFDQNGRTEVFARY
jgi:hypothetical protein